MTTNGWRLGVDVGGTFTDAVLTDQRHRLYTSKVPSTPEEPAEGFLRAIDQVMEEAGAIPEDAQMVIHGTTVATNPKNSQKGR